MYLTELSCKNFRNYPELCVNFSPEINFITGKNGTGKTNILEAIAVCSHIKSFRNVSDSDMMRWHTDNYYCSSRVHTDVVHRYEVGCSIEKERLKKRVKIDGREINRISDYYGKLQTVVFSPVDINLVNGAPEIRRRFIDSVISKTDPVYLENLNEFRKILMSRNRLLKSLRERKTSDTRQLDVFDALFAEKASYIIKKRRAFIEIFQMLFSESYRKIGLNDSGPDIKYIESINVDSDNDIVTSLISRRQKDIMSGNTGAGPQRDDIRLQMSENIHFTSYASQGQRRTAGIALKAAEFSYLEKKLSTKAIILVDDIFSELDEERRANMVKILSRGNQVIFTMVDIRMFNIDLFPSVKTFSLEKEAHIIEK